MAGGQPGSNSRGRGGKFRKFTRGGGKHFSRDLRPIDSDGNEIGMWNDDKKKEESGSDDDSEEDSEESSDDGKPQAEQSRADRKAVAKARKEAAAAKKKGQIVEVGDLPPSESEEDSDDDMPANPNHSKAARNQTKARVPDEVDEAAEGVKKLAVGNNRKERESIEAAQAKERYRKLHEAGKTDEAKADLARLRLIREQRAADAARRAAEKEERDAQEAAKRAEIEKKEAKKREAALGPAAAKKGKK
ncbi:MFS monocarboxylate transporter [Colletotrichum sojae]|uniref:MFS monocarboxylate transporter n=1 Tax=Colletotrichum sojae TaxID=2175907 RepID=A0A8H6JN25_9PEZI|nr:MFS monocarboxylate transporter [Colletotrichum sojae]